MKNFCAFLAYLALCLLPSACLGHQDGNHLGHGHRKCGTPDPKATPETLGFADMVKEYHSQAEGRRRLNMAFSVVVPTYYHVIRADDTEFISTQNVQDQNDALNQAFAGTGFQFEIKAITFTANEDWYVSEAGELDDTEMREALHVGGLESLNVYFTKTGGGDIEDEDETTFGIATLPEAFLLDNVKLDGIVINEITLPNVYDWELNQGLTLAHETGHWLNLYHTFNGGCDDVNGDFIDDTAWESDSIDGCPEFGTVDTCEDRPGFDNVNNYMNYADDACLTEFTPMQIVRMHTAWIVYRESEENFIEPSSKSLKSPKNGKKKSKNGLDDKSKGKKGKYSSTDTLCGRRCRLFVPVQYSHIDECIEEQCGGGGNSCDYPAPVHLEKGKTGLVQGSMDPKLAAGLENFPLPCDDLTIDTTRKWFEVEGDGTTMKISASSASFYPLLAIFEDGCDLTCVKYEEDYENDGTKILGGTETTFESEMGVKYLIVVFGEYGGDFDLSVESNITPDS